MNKVDFGLLCLPLSVYFERITSNIMFTLHAERQLCTIKLTEPFEEFHFSLAYFKTWMPSERFRENTVLGTGCNNLRCQSYNRQQLQGMERIRQEGGPLTWV